MYLLRKLRLILASCVFGGLTQAGAEQQAMVNPGGKLETRGQYVIPLPELSGLTLGKAGGLEILAIGDAGYGLVQFSLDGATGEGRSLVHDLGPRLGAPVGSASQWEAIASDGVGNLCILSETTSELVCLDRELNPLARFSLDVSPDAKLKALREAEPNSRGEGLLLLRGGHVLLLKEKEPALLVEFGPPGAAPMGYDQDRFLAAGEAFRWPAGSLVALKTWEFAKGLKDLAQDASELALGPDRRLYLLSQKSATLVRLEARLGLDDKKVHEEAYWQLPGNLDKAEGLVIDDTLHPWVAIDSKRLDRPNLFRLSPIPAGKGP